MALHTTNKIQDNYLDQIRTDLETIGYWEGMVRTGAFSNSAVPITIEGLSLGTCVPIPVDSTVFAEIQYTTYGDVTGTDYGQMGNVRFGGGRDGSGNVSLAEVVGTTTTLIQQDGAACLDFNAGATANPLTFAVSANTTLQGINITVSGTASSTTYLTGRMTLICAKKDGAPRKYIS